MKVRDKGIPLRGLPYEFVRTNKDIGGCCMEGGF